MEDQNQQQNTFHIHNGIDMPQINPNNLLGFRIDTVADPTVAPTDSPQSGTIRFLSDGTTIIQWIFSNGVWVSIGDTTDTTIQSFEAGENISTGNVVSLGQYTSQAFVTSRTIADSYVDEANPTTNYGTANTCKMGEDSNGKFRYAYLKFQVNQTGDPIQYDKVYLRLYFSTTNSSMVLTIKRVTSAWDESTITYNNQPTSDSVAFYSSIALPASAGSVNIDITRLYSLFASGAVTNYGIIIEAGGVGAGGLVEFVSKESAVTAQNPSYIIYGLYNQDKIYKTDGSNLLSYYAFKGFSEETKTTGQQCRVNMGSIITTTGLTTGAQYYLNNSTAGAITTTFPSTSNNRYSLGTALSTTQLKIDKSPIRFYEQRAINSVDNAYIVFVTGIPPLYSKLEEYHRGVVGLGEDVTMIYSSKGKLLSISGEEGILWTAGGGTPSISEKTVTLYNYDCVAVGSNYIILRRTVAGYDAEIICETTI